MAKKAQYPKKNFASYLLPFLLIIALLGGGWYALHERVNLSDLVEFLMPPQVAKDEKVTLIYQEGKNEVQAWSQKTWTHLSPETFLQVGDSIKTDRAGVIVLRFFEGSEVRLSGSSTIKLIRLDKDEISGNHLSLELVSGRMWARIQKGNTSDADFIIDTVHQSILIDEPTIVDVSINPEATRVIGGQVNINIAEKKRGARRPLGRVELTGGEQIIYDDLVIDQLKNGEKAVSTSLDAVYASSEWYLWNLEKEEKLPEIVEITSPDDGVERIDLLEELEPGVVSVRSPKKDATVGPSTLVQGAYDADLISKIFVNGKEAILGLNGEWESLAQLTESKNIITVTAIETDSEAEKKVKVFSVQVQDKGPLIGKITAPEIDENDNGELQSKSLELKGQVSDTAVRICVSHNDEDTPYCLKQFKSGDTNYRYLGSISYGNVITGKNKYTIYAYDEFDNVSERTVYIFQGEAKPSERVEGSEDTTSSGPTSTDTPSPGSKLSKPVITQPSSEGVFQSNSDQLAIKGTVDSRSNSLYVNEKKASYSAGASGFEVTLDLDPGENIITFQTSDKNGNKSKKAVLTVMYIEEVEEE